MERNRNIDIIRSIALLLVLVYHGWVKIGSISIGCEVVQTVIRLGGEIGVTTFFALSGYGIYQSLHRMEQEGKIQFFLFIKKRLKRILPQYYFNLLIVLLLTSGAIYLSTMHIWDIAAHFLLIHNLFPSYSGAINGVLWTMGVTCQFYLIAIPLYKLLNKIGLLFIPLGILCTISCKAIAFHYVLADFIGADNYVSYSFWIGRSMIITSLDNFLIGMGVAFVTQKYREIKKKWMAVIGLALSMAVLYFVCKEGLIYGIHTDNWSGYLWHSQVAISIGSIMLCSCYLGVTHRNIFSRGMLWLSKYEYGIYLWHLIIIDNLIQYSSMIQGMLVGEKYFAVEILFIIISVVVGVLFTQLIDERVRK